MRVSLINLNLVAEDAIGTCLIDQLRFFRQRGDDVRAYVLYPPHNVPDDVAPLATVVTLRALIEGHHEHFRFSDLYIYHYPGRYPLVESIRGIDRGTVIFYYHNVTPPELWNAEAGRDALMRGLEGASLVHYADLCITPSPFNKEDLVHRVRYPAERVHVLPLAVGLEELSPGPPDPELVRRYRLGGRPVLLFVGRMAPNKRVDLLIEALAQIQAQLPQAKLLLVGDDRSHPAFRDVVARTRSRALELGLAADVIWTGRVDQLLPYYRLADVYVTASLHEGFGLPLIEAMACGVPIVATRAGAMPWVLEDAGLLCQPGDAKELAQSVLQLLSSADLRRSLVERGLERARHFSRECYHAALAQILERAVTYTLPDPASAPALRGAGPRPRAGRDANQNQLLLLNLVDEIQVQSDIALRDYVVRSGVPLFGPLIVWVRRNLTSHLREPYLDPIIERQVSLNRRIAEWVMRATDRLGGSAGVQAELEERIASLEARIEELSRRLDPSGPGEGQ